MNGDLCMNCLPNQNKLKNMWGTVTAAVAFSLHICDNNNGLLCLFFLLFVLYYWHQSYYLTIVSLWLQWNLYLLHWAPVLKQHCSILPVYCQKIFMPVCHFKYAKPIVLCPSSSMELITFSRPFFLLRWSYFRINACTLASEIPDMFKAAPVVAFIFFNST